MDVHTLFVSSPSFELALLLKESCVLNRVAGFSIDRLLLSKVLSSFEVVVIGVDKGEESVVTGDVKLKLLLTINGE